MYMAFLLLVNFVSLYMLDFEFINIFLFLLHVKLGLSRKFGIDLNLKNYPI